MKNKSIASLLWLLLAVFCIAVLMFVAVVNSQAQTTVALSPAPRLSFPMANGAVNSLGCVFTYAAGTNTPLATYADGSNSPATNTNPVLLDAAGMPTASGSAVGIWLGPAKYKIAVWSAGGTNCALGSQQYVVDNVAGSNIGTGLVQLSVQAAPSCASGSYSIYTDGSGKIKMCVNGSVDTVLGASGLSGSLATPPPIGNTTPNVGTFTQVNASGTNSVGTLAAQGPWSLISNPSTAIWPALLTLPNGHLYALFMGNGGTSISSSVSTDGGQTWTVGSGPTIPGGTTVDYASMTLLQNGTVFLSYSVAATGTLLAQPGYIIGTISGDTITWGSYNQITIAGRSFCYDSSPVVQLGNGNLLLPVWCQANALATYSALDSGIVISTNGGSTWSAFNVIGASISVTGSSTNGYDESCMALMPSGDVVDILRHTNPGDPNGTFARSVSTNGGTTWSAPVDVINQGNTVGRPSCLVSGSQLIMVARMGIGPVGSQTGGSISSDEGVTWSTPSLLERGSGIDEYDALTTYNSGSQIGMVSSWATTGAFFSSLTTAGLVAPNGGSIGQIAATNVYAQNLYANSMAALYFPIAVANGRLVVSPLHTSNSENVIYFGTGQNLTTHNQFQFPDYDSTAGYPRIAIDTSGSYMCFGDDTAGDLVFGPCAGSPGNAYTWTSQPVTISQAGAFSAPGISDTLAWTQSTPSPTCQAGSLSSPTSTLRVKNAGKIGYIDYVLTIGAAGVGTCTGQISVTLPFTAKSISTLTCSDNNTAPPTAGASTISAGTAILLIGKYDGTTFAANNRIIACSGVIELQ